MKEKKEKKKKSAKISWQEGEKLGVRRELILLNLVVILLGALMILKPETSETVICRGIGIALILWGVIRAIVYLVHARHMVMGSFAMVQGALLIGFGIYFTAKPEVLAAFLMVGLAILLLVCSVLKLQYAIDLANLRAKTWGVQLVGAAIVAALGIVAFFNPFKAAEKLMVFIGIAFVFSGIWDMISVIILSVHMKRRVEKEEERLAAEALESGAIEAEFVRDDD